MTMTEKRLKPGLTLDEVIFQRIERAFALHLSLAESFSGAHGTQKLLTTYRSAIQKTLSLMDEMDVGSFCAHCASQERGSCCFEEVGDEYDPPLLLVNLLLSSELPLKREVPGNCCFFLGEKGCRLKGRYHFCVNYLCPDLRDFLGAEKIGNLLAAVGEEIAAGWEIERNIHFRLAALPGTAFHPDSSR
jgi:hypothetical protein